MRQIVFIIVLMMMIGPVSAHEQKTFSLLLKSDGPTPGNITEGVYQTDSVWFWMVDSTENATMQVNLEKGNLSLTSTILTKTCDLDEEGNKTNDECQVRFDVLFNNSEDTGIWNLSVQKWVDNTSNNTWNGTIKILSIESEMHEEEHNTTDTGGCEGTDCNKEISEEVLSKSLIDFNRKNLLFIVVIISGLGILGLGLSIMRKEDDFLQNEEKINLQSEE